MLTTCCSPAGSGACVHAALPGTSRNRLLLYSKYDFHNVQCIIKLAAGFIDADGCFDVDLCKKKPRTSKIIYSKELQYVSHWAYKLATGVMPAAGLRYIVNIGLDDGRRSVDHRMVVPPNGGAVKRYRPPGAARIGQIE